MESKGPVRVGETTAVFQRVELPFGLTLREVRLLGRELVVLPEAPYLQAPGPVPFEVEIADTDLAAFLERRAPGGLRDFFVQIPEGEVHVHATARMLIEIRAAAVCTLRIHEGRQLFVDLVKVDVLGVAARGMVQSQLDQINPVFDVDSVPFPVVLTTVEMGAGRVLLRGTLQPPVK